MPEGEVRPGEYSFVRNRVPFSSNLPCQSAGVPNEIVDDDKTNPDGLVNESIQIDARSELKLLESKIKAYITTIIQDLEDRLKSDLPEIRNQLRQIFDFPIFFSVSTFNESSSPPSLKDKAEEVYAYFIGGLSKKLREGGSIESIIQDFTRKRILTVDSSQNLLNNVSDFRIFVEKERVIIKLGLRAKLR